jgi:uncharacterized membrane protein (DUF373 family)
VTSMPDNPADVSEPGRGSPEERRTAGRAPSRSTRFAAAILERAQDIVSIVTGTALILLSAALLAAAIYEFFRRLSGTGLATNATDLLDQVLLVLILVEIVHTVVLSLRAHALVPQPFIVVGLVAVIRKLLFVLGNQQSISDQRLWIYIVMVAVFVTSLVAVSRFTNGTSSRGQS